MSRVTLRTDAPSAGSLAALLTDRVGAYEAHRLVWALFGDLADRRRDFVFRVDWVAGRPQFLIVSERLPEDDHYLFAIETKAYTPDLRAGDRLAFSTRVNPVVRRRQAGDRCRKFDIVMDEVRRRRDQGEKRVDRIAAAQAVLPDWLARQGQRLGFSLKSADAGAEVHVEAYDTHRFRSAAGHGVSVASVEVRGLLRVEEPERFLRALFRGMGSARAFGMGLLLVRRA